MGVTADSFVEASSDSVDMRSPVEKNLKTMTDQIFTLKFFRKIVLKPETSVEASLCRNDLSLLRS